MAKIDPFIVDLTPETILQPETLFYLNRYLHDLFRLTTDGTGELSESDDLLHVVRARLSSLQERVKELEDTPVIATPIKGDVFQVETAVSFAVPSNVDEAIIICTNASGVAITITLPKLFEGTMVKVTREGVGSVTISGNGSNIIGLTNQVMPSQYDTADLLATSTEWVV